MKEKYEKLPLKFKEKWLKALRSGYYKQDKEFNGFLITRDDDFLHSVGGKFCCLGVACRISGVKEKRPSIGFIDNLKNQNRIPKILHGNDQLPTKLVEMNDSGKSFKQIATWIEKHL